MLPFILAVIVAYVLTPLVARVERLRVPRAAAILLVYFATLGSIYIGFATTFPRIYVEGVKFAREAPALMEKLSTSSCQAAAAAS